MKNEINLLKPKIKTKKTNYKKKAWDAFSLYIRLKGRDSNGVVYCYTCGKPKTVKTIQAGHGIGGRSNAVLFDERVVRPQCVGCNVFGGGQYRIFTHKLINELGLDVYNKVSEDSMVSLPLKEYQFKEIYEKYKQKCEELS